VLLWHPAAATIDRYLLAAGPTAANTPQLHAVVDGRDGQTDGNHTVTQTLPKV